MFRKVGRLCGAGKDNFQNATVSLFTSILLTNNKIEFYSMENSNVKIHLSKEGKLSLVSVYGGRKKYRELVSKTFTLFQSHYNYLESLNKKIIVSDSKNNGMNNNTFTIPTQTGFEAYEDKYNLNDSILRGPFLGPSDKILVKEYILSYMSFYNKIYDLLNFTKLVGSKKELKVLFKISKNGDLTLEDTQVNNKIKLDYFKKEMLIINEWLASEKQKGNLLQPAINILNEKCDYYLEYSNFTNNKEE